ncbi:MAG: aromatic ring-opening dioxygenase subunit LigB, partial [Thermomicrobiales bacterium]
MPLVAAAILPHGWNLVPELVETGGDAPRTQAAMQRAGVAFREAGVEVIVLAGPHGIRVKDAMCMLDVGRVAGSLTLNGRTVDLNVPVDRALVESIGTATSAAGIPLALAGYSGNRPDQAVAPLDWGGFVPLWFLGNGNPHAEGAGSVLSPAPDVESVPPVVIITPARGLPRQQMIDFGQVIGEVVSNDPRRIGFVASCDWSHVHLESGPYGYDPIAPEMDKRILEAIETDTLHALIDLPQADVDRAAIDGLWQTLMLAGVRDTAPLP